ncbi:MAG: RNA polymerase sigma factor [Deltaproteobacteria bacterium]|nr:RNA polymerase sigma factor [Deltaproteobacteria bacterium]
MGNVDQVKELASSGTLAAEDREVADLEARREQTLLKRARAGDRSALRDLLAPQTEALFARVILPRTGDRAEAEDILKATMVTAIEKLDTFQWTGRSIYFWLRQIAANKVIDHHRRTQRGRRLADALAREGDLLAVAPSGFLGPEASFLQGEERRLNQERIAGALAKINARYRRAIELRLVEELSREACAEVLDVTVGTFDVVFFRAVRAFRAAFGER